MTITARRTVLLCTAALTLAGLGGTSQAAVKKKPVCNLVTDGKGDAKPTGSSTSDNNLDIVSADLATNGATLTVVFRLAGWDASDSAAPFGRGYAVGFTVDDNATGGNLRAVTSPAGSKTYDGHTAATGFDIGDSHAKATFDAKAKEVRISIPLDKLQMPVKSKSVFKAISATTYRPVFTVNSSLGTVDTAATTTTYVAGTASCVKVGS